MYTSVLYYVCMGKFIVLEAALNCLEVHSAEVDCTLRPPFVQRRGCNSGVFIIRK